MITWATPVDLMQWTGEAEPANAEQLLRRASQLVTRATRNATWRVGSNGLPTDSAVVDALREATCAQAQAWLALDVDPVKGSAAADAGVVVSRSLGSAAISYAAPATVTVEARARAADTLAGAASDILDEAGLITAAVSNW